MTNTEKSAYNSGLSDAIEALQEVFGELVQDEAEMCRFLARLKVAPYRAMRELCGDLCDEIRAMELK